MSSVVLRAWRPKKGDRGPYSDVILKPFQMVMGWRFAGKVVVDCRFEEKGITPRLLHWINTSVRTRMVVKGAWLDVWRA